MGGDLGGEPLPDTSGSPVIDREHEPFAREQAADILAWGIGDGVLLPRVPANDLRSLTSAFQLMTGEAPPSA